MKFFEDMKPGFYKMNECEYLKKIQRVNALISYAHHHNFSTDRKILDYKKCVAMKAKIEESIDNGEEDIYTFS